jgi:hypothetical protein
MQMYICNSTYNTVLSLRTQYVNKDSDGIKHLEQDSGKMKRGEHGNGTVVRNSKRLSDPKAPTLIKGPDPRKLHRRFCSTGSDQCLIPSFLRCVPLNTQLFSLACSKNQCLFFRPLATLRLRIIILMNYCLLVPLSGLLHPRRLARARQTNTRVFSSPVAHHVPFPFSHGLLPTHMSGTLLLIRVVIKFCEACSVHRPPALFLPFL